MKEENKAPTTQVSANANLFNTRKDAGSARVTTRANPTTTGEPSERGDSFGVGRCHRLENPALVFTPKTDPVGMLVLWDDQTLEGGSFHEEVPVHGRGHLP